MPESNQPASETAVQTAIPAQASWQSSLARLMIVMAGIAVGQFILYGPSLLGFKVLLPLDILGLSGVYLPVQPGQEIKAPHNHILSDMVLIGEPTRMVLVDEVKAGRWPSWTTHQFAGAPTMAARYSPFLLLYMLVSSPTILPWVQMLVAQIAGVGLYVFARRVLAAAFWPATIMAWAYPLTGFFIYWQGYGLSFAVCWLPWMMFAVDWVICGCSLWRGPVLAIITALTVISGNADVSGQTLLTCGLFAVWRLVENYLAARSAQRTVRAVLTLSAAWALGLLISTPYLLPILEYTKTGARFARRSEGEEERKPIGLAALPQVVFPTMYGSTEAGEPWYPPANQGNVLESSATTYAGLLTTLLAAPLAFTSRRYRSLNLFWILLACLALSWQLNIPGVVNVMRSGPFKMFSHNRFVFAATFGIVALATVGLNQLWQKPPQRRHWFIVSTALLALLAVGALIRGPAVFQFLETSIKDQYAGMLLHRYPQAPRAELEKVAQTESQKTVASFGPSLFITYFSAAALSFVAGAGWLFIWLLPKHHRSIFAGISVVLLFDLVTFGFGRSAQCDWSMYYPRISVLEQMAKAGEDWRMIGYDCLPPALSSTHGLKDVRGYDAVDPNEYVELLMRSAASRSNGPMYATTQDLIPTYAWDSKHPQQELPSYDAIRLHPILDMLGVKYVVFRGVPPELKAPNPPIPIVPAFAKDSYWAMENPRALPRVFVPRHVVMIADPDKRLEALGSKTFDPNETAYVEVATSLKGDGVGTAKITSQTPTKIEIAAQMETPGLLVLADRWDAGWVAEVDGKLVPILKANHALRGIELTPGEHKVVYRYEPNGAKWGMRLAGLSFLALIGWCGLGRFGTPLPELPKVDDSSDDSPTHDEGPSPTVAPEIGQSRDNTTGKRKNRKGKRIRGE